MRCDLKKCLDGDEEEILRGIEILERRKVYGNKNLYFNTKPAWEELVYYINSCWVEEKVAEILGLHNQPDYNWLDSTYKHKDATRDTVEGIEIKTTGRSLEVNLDEWKAQPEVLHGATIIALYNWREKNLYTINIKTYQYNILPVEIYNRFWEIKEKVEKVVEKIPQNYKRS